MTDNRHGITRTSSRIHAAGIDHRADGGSARQADKALLELTSSTTLDTTHFDTVRFPAPTWAAERFAAAAVDGSLAYTTYRGSDDVRRHLAEPLSTWLGFPIDPETSILLSPGTQAGLFTSLSALVDSGDRVALIDPDYLFSERILTFLGAQVTHVRLQPSSEEPAELVPDLNQLEDAFRSGVRLFVFSHPNNPTGAVYSREVLGQIAALAVRYDVTVLVDELYGRLVYDGTPFVHLASLPGMADRTITLLGPSKTESLSGYRLGVVVAPPAVLEAAEDVLSLTALRAPGYAQHVLKGWLVDDVEWIADRIQQLQGLRALSIKHLSQLDWITLAPQQGTAYLFPDVTALGLPDRTISETLARRADVLISPGYQFGPSGVGHFRVCFARDEQIWDNALGRIVDVLDSLHRNGGKA
ncbi:aminotransferase class I/II-fold pyridoxal phosphate-dependent enzyme [Rhodococcus wratislaviensis]|uniref:Putative aspartate aminotransferase n=1 Tax=Rhodococcus wratislaviensis NBRC 100605 TaxID=1219028 RepID=X0Q1N6_RHOWR|nr:aminotransferase class I/II-fold pyridoxal phosphate-dependent enzyme [Rhodococcus wratislaviensis]GAF50029.1 putative aspartate aminotransferase [Rhodococcus wratislaviensis NBRC 100605]